MFFKKKAIGILLLLTIVVVFACFGNMNEIEYYNLQAKEGFDDSIPICQSGENVPDCYATPMDQDIFDYDDKYILKTELVPPIFPACPSVINNHAHGNNLFDKEVDDNVNTIISNTDIEKNISNSEEQTITSNITNNTTINNDGKNGAGKNGTGKNGTGKNGANDSSILPANNDETNKKHSKCPPCPACERCPEPAFTCEKVVNYKSPASSKYLPIPVLNDFSTFPSS